METMASASIVTSWRDRFSLRSTDINWVTMLKWEQYWRNHSALKAFYEHLYGFLMVLVQRTGHLLIEVTPHMRLHIGGGIQSTMAVMIQVRRFTNLI